MNVWRWRWALSHLSPVVLHYSRMSLPSKKNHISQWKKNEFLYIFLLYLLVFFLCLSLFIFGLGNFLCSRWLQCAQVKLHKTTKCEAIAIECEPVFSMLSTVKYFTLWTFHCFPLWLCHRCHQFSISFCCIKVCVWLGVIVSLWLTQNEATVCRFVPLSTDVQCSVELLALRFSLLNVEWIISDNNEMCHHTNER